MPETAEYPQPMERNLEADDDYNKIRGKLDEYNTMFGGIVRPGRVVKKNDKDPKDPGDIPRVLVQIGSSEEGGYIRNWLPWVTARAGYDGEWWHPDLDEQVLVLASSGNVTQGFIVGSLYRGCLSFDSGANGAIDIEQRDPIPASEADKEIHQRFYKDGTSISYDRNTHNLAFALKSQQDKEEALIRFSAIMDPEGATADTGTVSLEVGKKAEPDITFKVDNSPGNGGEVTLVSSLKTTLIVGTVADPKVTLLADANEESVVLSVGDGTTNTTINDGAITLSSGETTITVNKDGAVDIDAGSNDITVIGNVKVTGTLDVS